MRRRSVNIAIVLCLLGLMDVNSATALQESTHEIINEQAARQSTLDQVLKEQLVFPNGINTFVRDDEVFDWIGEGGKLEDEILAGDALVRFLRHFHDPLYQADGSGRGPWSQAGLANFDSSVRWMQRTEQDWSWQEARRRYADALKSSDKDARESGFAALFRTLGQIMHLVVDASVPLHVRNDAHPLGEIYGNYEHWVKRQHDGFRDDGTQDPDEEANFVSTFLSNPFPFDASILEQPTNDAVAKIPVARLIDTDTYQGTDPNVTLGSAIGIAEFANANFFSEDTGDGQYPFPNVNTLIPTQRQAPRGARIRRYYKKAPGDGIEVDPVLAECILDEAAIAEGLPISRIGTCTDENVWTQMASIMLPRAVSYAKGVLDYFFRGTLDFTISTTATSSNQTIAITNTSSEAMDGTFALYADNFSDIRSPVEGASFNLNLGPGASSDPLAFTPPTAVQAYTLVFQGKLGLEEGAVAGRVKTIPVNAFFVWHVRFYNDQFDGMLRASRSGYFVTSLQTSGRHTGQRRDYIFFAFVNNPNLSVSHLDVSELNLTARTSAARFGVPRGGVNYNFAGGDALAIIQPAGPVGCGPTPCLSYAPALTALYLASTIDPRFFAPNTNPPPNNYVYLSDNDGLLRDTGVAASDDILVTKKLTPVSFEQIQQIAQDLHPLLVPPISLPQSAVFYAFAEFDIPNVDSWNLDFQAPPGQKLFWGGTTSIESISVAEMWDLTTLTLRVSGETDIDIYVPQERIQKRDLNFVFGAQYRAMVDRPLESFVLRHNPKDPFNPIRETIP